MNPHHRSWSLPKPGLADSENEDAHGAAAELGRFAVADGASEGWRSQPWAKELVAAFMLEPPEPGTYSDWLIQVRKRFQGTTQSEVTPLSWYAATKQEEGAFATFVGLSLAQTSTGRIRWKGCAVGDACLLHLRNGQAITRFPLQSAAEFDNQPALIGSNNSATFLEPAWHAGLAEPGDWLLLASDALAAYLYLLLEQEQNLRPIVEELMASSGCGTFDRMIRSSQSQQLMRNDDATLIVIHLDPASRPE